MADYPIEFERGSVYKQELTPEQMLGIIFDYTDYTAKIANESSLQNVLVLMANMGRDMILSDR